MGDIDFKVDQIDHIHVFVPDQYQAAQWYKKVLGLEILKEHEDWAVEDGPLTISSNGGDTSLALFKGEPIGNSAQDYRRNIAFRVSGEGFLTFLKRLDQLEIKDKRGKALTVSDVVDHERSYSIYFSDPYGNPYELTTYDYGLVKAGLQR